MICSYHTPTSILLLHFQSYLQSQLKRRLSSRSTIYCCISFCYYALGDFNVSNLMGIKRRMIDIGKKIGNFLKLYILKHFGKSFCKMFENVQFFSHLHLKYAKSAIMTQNFFFLRISIWVTNKRRIADFKFVDADLNKCP